MSFGWNEQKRRTNIKKHGIDFKDVPELFDGDIVILLMNASTTENLVTLLWES